MTSAGAKVLLVDDDEAFARMVNRGLRDLPGEPNISLCHNAHSALEHAEANRPNVAVLDLSIDEKAGPSSGLGLVAKLTNLDPTCRLIVLTGNGGTDYGIAALREGASSFLTKPPNMDHLRALVTDGINYSKLKREHVRLKAAVSKKGSALGLHSENRKMIELLKQAEFAAGHALPIILTGETGAGKGVVAKAIHRASGRKGPFIRFQPSFRGADLISSELFGHERGAFTGATLTRVGLLEEAHNGTLFIDEVDELPGETQVLLLDALQEKRFKRLGSSREIGSNFRIISATNREIGSVVQEKKLREDFFHRIAQQQLAIPPLRERLEDIEELANFFVSEISTRERLKAQRVRECAIQKLRSYDWPGNVRELQAVTEMATYRASLDGRPTIEAEDIHLATTGEGELRGMLREQVSHYEQKLVLDALARTDNNQSQAAKLLGIDRTSLRRILAKK